MLKHVYNTASKTNLLNRGDSDRISTVSSTGSTGSTGSSARSSSPTPSVSSSENSSENSGLLTLPSSPDKHGLQNSKNSPSVQDLNLDGHIGHGHSHSHGRLLAIPGIPGNGCSGTLDRFHYKKHSSSSISPNTSPIKCKGGMGSSTKMYYTEGGTLERNYSTLKYKRNSISGFPPPISGTHFSASATSLLHRNCSRLSITSNSSSSTASSSSFLNGLYFMENMVPLRIYANGLLRQDIEYKTVSVGAGTTSEEVIKSLFSKCKVRFKDPKLFSLVMEVEFRGPSGGTKANITLEDNAIPLQLQECYPKGQAKFSLQMDKDKGKLVKIHFDDHVDNPFGCQYKSLMISEKTNSGELIDILFRFMPSSSESESAFGSRKTLNSESDFYLKHDDFFYVLNIETSEYKRQLNYDDLVIQSIDTFKSSEGKESKLVLRQVKSILLLSAMSAKVNRKSCSQSHVKSHGGSGFSISRSKSVPDEREEVEEEANLNSQPQSQSSSSNSIYENLILEEPIFSRKKFEKFLRRIPSKDKVKDEKENSGGNKGKNNTKEIDCNTETDRNHRRTMSFSNSSSNSNEKKSSFKNNNNNSNSSSTNNLNSSNNNNNSNSNFIKQFDTFFV